MAFGGLLDGFLNEKPLGESRKSSRHHMRYDHQRRSLTGGDQDRIMVKKMSTASYAGHPMPKYSWPMVTHVGRQGEAGPAADGESLQDGRSTHDGRPRRYGRSPSSARHIPQPPPRNGKATKAHRTLERRLGQEETIRMFSGNMGIVNDYIMFRLLMEDQDKAKQKRPSLTHRNSLFVPRASIGDMNEPFCSPIVPHIPIRQRLATRRCTSVDVNDDPMSASFSSNSFYGQPRRRRMSLLQTLRQQNRQLADSGLEINRARTDSESTNRDTASPPAKVSPPVSPTKKTFASIKSKLFGKRDKRSESRSSATVYQSSGEYSQSCDIINNGRSRKSPSTTNDSGRGSQGHLEERIETVAIIERPDDEIDVVQPPYRRIRTSSCPDLSVLRISSKAPIVDSESDDDHLLERNSSPLSAADCLLERRMLRKAMEADERRKVASHGRPAVAISAPRLVEEDEQSIGTYNDDVISRISSRRSNQTEDLADFDDNISTIVLDHFLPLSRSSNIPYDDDTLSSEFSSSLALNDDNHEDLERQSGTASVQTDLSLINIEEEVAEYLTRLNEGQPVSQEGMNFIAKHFFEYQSFVNMPHKAVQLHKVPAQHAGTDPSMGWAPKNMNKAGKNQPAPASRANRIHRDPRPRGTKHGRAGKHEHRDWGDKHGELKDEKVAPHKDAWTKFLSREDPGKRTMFECQFEDRVLATEDETLAERVARGSPDNLEFQMAYNASKNSRNNDCELLTILTFAPNVQFVTVTVKKAKTLPFNNSPFARIMLFDGRRLMEQKQTTVDPSVGHKSSLESSKPSSSSVCSSSSSGGGGDAIFSESFLFHVMPAKMDNTHVVIEMFDHDETNRAVSIGHCVIGRSGDVSGTSHWIQMLKKNGLPVCMWHKIGVN